VIEAGDENAVPWMEPTDADESLLLNLERSSKLHHQSGTNAGFVDGAVRYLKASVPAEVWRALLSISGNDGIKTDDW
jgi:prepilin-type processing-associated H-X9-DG protein